MTYESSDEKQQPHPKAISVWKNEHIYGRCLLELVAKINLLNYLTN